MTKQISNSLSVLAAVAVTIPTLASADVSSQEVWETWKSYAESFGQTVTVGSQDTNGDTLTLRDISISFDFPEGNAASTMEFLELRERGDGTVAVTMAPDMPFSMSANPPEGEAIDLAMIIRQVGTSIVASGDPGDITFGYIASELGVEIDKVIVDGEAIDMGFHLAMAGINGNYHLTEGAPTTYSSDFSAENTTVEMRVIDTEKDEVVELSGSVQNLAGTTNVSISETYDPANPASAFDGSLLLDATITSGISEYRLDIIDPEQSATINATGESGTLDVALRDGSIEYGGATTGVTYEIQSSEIPFPQVELSFAEIAVNFLMPMKQNDNPDDFGLLVRFAGLEISETIWNMLDPAEIMPRAPATINLDLAGKMNWLLDITDPEQSEEFDGEMPAEVHELNINDITVAAAGAQVKGDGAFTFDHTDLESFDGMPAPTGTLSLNIDGANGLLNRLIQMGVLPEDQAMGARMMLGLFAVAGTGEDELTSTIEFKADGTVFANSMQIK